MEVKCQNLDNLNFIDTKIPFKKTRFSKYCNAIDELSQGYAGPISHLTSNTAGLTKYSFIVTKRVNTQAQHCTDPCGGIKCSQYQMKKNMSRQGYSWDSPPTGRFFRSLKTEWMRQVTCHCFTDARPSIVNQMSDYYSQTKTHRHNGGLPPNNAEQLYCNSFKSVENIT